jgi:excisionase family DNA binding protein
MMTDTFMSVEDVAKRLGVSERTVTREIQAGKLKAFRVGGKTLRITLEAFQEYVKAQEVKPSEPLDAGKQGE